MTDQAVYWTVIATVIPVTSLAFALEVRWQSHHQKSETGKDRFWKAIFLLGALLYGFLAVASEFVALLYLGGDLAIPSAPWRPWATTTVVAGVLITAVMPVFTIISDSSNAIIEEWIGKMEAPEDK